MRGTVLNTGYWKQYSKAKHTESEELGEEESHGEKSWEKGSHKNI